MTVKTNEFKTALSEIEKIAPQFTQLSQKLNGLYWQKEEERIALSYELRDLDQLPPGRDEGEAFFNEFLDEMESKAVERLQNNFSAFAQNRGLHTEPGRVRTAAINALDPRYRLDFGLDAFLIPAMRAAVPDLLQFIHWPINPIGNEGRLARMEKLRADIEALNAERDAIGEKLAGFGITPKRPGE
jgi:hypothetical protein